MNTSSVNQSTVRHNLTNSLPGSGRLSNKRKIKKSRLENNIKRNFPLRQLSKSFSSLAELSSTNQTLNHYTRTLRVVGGVSIGVAVGTILGGPIGTGLGITLGSAVALVGPQKVMEIFQRVVTISYKYINHGVKFIHNNIKNKTYKA